MSGQGALRHRIDGAEAVGDRRERIAVVNPATATEEFLELKAIHH
jgi:hypothetical protein